MHPSHLDSSAAARERSGRAALEWVLRWFDDEAARPLYPQVGAAALTRRIAGDLPLDPSDPMDVLAAFADTIAPGARDNRNTRMFGYVQSSGAWMGVLADFLTSALNQNTTSWRSAPSATTVERQVVGWLKTVVDFDPAGDGLLVSGGSVANLVGIAAALARVAPDVPHGGVRTLAGDPVIYASAAAHMSIVKAASILGLGRRCVRRIPVNEAFCIDIAALETAWQEDTAAGRVPICAVANAGDVNTGAVDPLVELAAWCRSRGLWLHADAAYGGFATLAPSGRDALAGLGSVDSLSLDPHKWLSVPLDAGLVLVKDVAALRRAFSYSGDYVDVIAAEDMSEYAFWDYGPELSRRFRALKIWMVMRTHGTRALGEAVERSIRLARQLGDAIDRSTDFERLAPVPLSIVCFRYRPAGAADDSLDDLNRRLMLAVQRRGVAYLSNATINGVFALRACLVNHRTSEEDLGILLDEIRSAAQPLKS